MENSDDAFRLMAVEMLMIDMLTSRYLSTPDPVATAAEHREHIRNVLSQIAVPFLRDAGASEFVIGEIGDAIDLLITIAGETAGLRVDEQRQP
jgi:hypothetical protein